MLMSTRSTHYTSMMAGIFQQEFVSSPKNTEALLDLGKHIGSSTAQSSNCQWGSEGQREEDKINVGQLRGTFNVTINHNIWIFTDLYTYIQLMYSIVH